MTTGDNICTFGHRYFAISFIIAQSAFRCSLFEMNFSLSNGSEVVELAGFESFGFSTLSGVRAAAFSSFESFEETFCGGFPEIPVYLLKELDVTKILASCFCW